MEFRLLGPVVQLGKTSPSRGEDHRFKSGPAHFIIFFLDSLRWSFCSLEAYMWKEKMWSKGGVWNGDTGKSWWQKQNACHHFERYWSNLGDSGSSNDNHSWCSSAGLRFRHRLTFGCVLLLLIAFLRFFINPNNEPSLF